MIGEKQSMRARKADVIIGVLTNAALASEYTTAEWIWADEHKKPLQLLRFEDCIAPFSVDTKAL